jgi:TolA-binding protein
MKRMIIFCLLIAGFTTLPSASAGTKEDLMRLQKDVQTLRDQIQEIDKGINDKMDGIKSLVVQLNDQVAKSNLVLEKISSLVENLVANEHSVQEALIKAEAARLKANEALNKEVSKVSAKVDDSATRISAISLRLSELLVLIKAGENPPAAIQSPEVMYNQAYHDFVQGNLDPAIQEFNAFIDTYSGGDKAALALLNLGDAYLMQKKIQQANIAYTRVINNYSETIHVAPALFKRAKVELDMKESQNAIDDLNRIIEKYPTSQDAQNAKAMLKELVVPAKSAPTRPKIK